MKTETNRSTGLREEIEALRHMTVGQLKDKYRDVFSESSRSNHKQFLFRRIAWRMQANAYGGLSERARRRALEIANDADLRIRAPKNFLKVDLDESRTLETRVAPTEDPRLPIPAPNRRRSCAVTTSARDWIRISFTKLRNSAVDSDSQSLHNATSDTVRSGKGRRQAEAAG
jgi:hypothetical protein